MNIPTLAELAAQGDKGAQSVKTIMAGDEYNSFTDNIRKRELHQLERNWFAQKFGTETVASRNQTGRNSVASPSEFF